MRSEIHRSTWYLPIGTIVLLLNLVVFLDRGSMGSRALLAAAAVGFVLWGLVNRLMHNDAVVLLDEEGIWDGRWGFDHAIPWSWIESVRECGLGEICLGLSSPLDKKPDNSGSLFKSEASLRRLETHAWGLKISRRELLRQIRERVDQARL